MGSLRRLAVDCEIDLRGHSGATACTSLKTLSLGCETALPDLSALIRAADALRTLQPSRRCPTCRRSRRCRRSTSIAALPDRAARPLGARIVAGSSTFCNSLTALPDLSSLAGLKVEGLPRHLQAWEEGGRKSLTVPIKFQPGARVRITGRSRTLSSPF